MTAQASKKVIWKTEAASWARRSETPTASRVSAREPKGSSTLPRSEKLLSSGTPGYSFERSTVTNHWNLLKDKYFELFLAAAMKHAPDSKTGKEPK